MQVKKGRGPQNARRIFMKILDSIFFVILFKTKNEFFSFLIEYFLYLLAMLFFRLIKICTSFKWPWLSSLLKTIILHPTIMCKCSYPYLLFFQRFHLQKWKYYYNKNTKNKHNLHLNTKQSFKVLIEWQFYKMIMQSLCK